MERIYSQLNVEAFGIVASCMRSITRSTVLPPTLSVFLHLLKSPSPVALLPRSIIEKFAHNTSSTRFPPSIPGTFRRTECYASRLRGAYTESCRVQWWHSPPVEGRLQETKTRHQLRSYRDISSTIPASPQCFPSDTNGYRSE